MTSSNVQSEKMASSRGPPLRPLSCERQPLTGEDREQNNMSIEAQAPGSFLCRSKIKDVASKSRTSLRSQGCCQTQLGNKLLTVVIFIPLLLSLIGSMMRLREESPITLLGLLGGIFIWFFIYAGLMRRRSPIFNRLRMRFAGRADRAFVMLAAPRVSSLLAGLFEVFSKPTIFDKNTVIWSIATLQLQIYVVLRRQEATAGFGTTEMLLSVILSAVTLHYRDSGVYREFLVEGIIWATVLIGYGMVYPRITKTETRNSRRESNELSDN